jgi:hypothetical protein
MLAYHPFELATRWGRRVEHRKMFCGWKSTPCTATVANTSPRDELRNDYLYLYYTTDDDVRVNGYIKNASGFLGNDIFKKLSKSGIVTGYSATIKALFRFVLVHCDKATEYEGFESTKRKNLGLGPLIRGLKKLAKRNSQDTEVDEQDGADANALEVSDSVENNKKRTFHESEDEADTLTANKKARTD